jgi:hypothetical protein
MDIHEANRMVRRYLTRWGRRPYSELVALMDLQPFPQSRHLGNSGAAYCIGVKLSWENERVSTRSDCGSESRGIRVEASIHDGGLRPRFFPSRAWFVARESYTHCGKATRQDLIPGARVCSICKSVEPQWSYELNVRDSHPWWSIQGAVDPILVPVAIVVASVRRLGRAISGDAKRPSREAPSGGRRKPDSRTVTAPPDDRGEIEPVPEVAKAQISVVAVRTVAVTVQEVTLVRAEVTGARRGPGNATNE